jgi:hypothetical protein
MSERVASIPPSAGGRRLRRLVAGFAALVVACGLGFVGGNLAAPQVNLREVFWLGGHAAARPPREARPTIEDVRKGLAAAERKLRDRLDQKRGEAAAAARTLYLMERQKAAPQALGRLRQQAEKLGRETTTLEERLAEVRALRQGLGQADEPRMGPGQAREQEELDELTVRARHWLEGAGGHD